MSTRFIFPVALLLTSTAAGIGPAESGELDMLERDRTIADFRTEAAYENEAGKIIGARFRHVPTRHVLDVLRIQSIPQGFMWVNSPPPSDQGEPHTLEHLLLGKGTRGRYVASLEDMSLGRSSAFTQQRRTCYHFSTEAGTDVFFNLFEAKLNAMLNPNFTDEEIRREVCNLGVVEKKEGTGLWLEEKGTVYNEMVSSYERPWGNLFREMSRMQFGSGHVLSLESGGLPSAIREMTPEDIRKFHASTHHLGNMGSMVSIGDEISLEDCLERLSAIFKKVEPDAGTLEDPADLWSRIPPPHPAPRGEIAVTHFPHQNPSEPGLVVLGWPAEMDIEPGDVYMLDLFRKLLASGQTSNLYRKFIDSQTREMDIGANSVFSWLDNEPGLPLYVGFSAVDPAACDRASLEEIRTKILDEIRSIAALEPGSEALEKFNRRARNQILQDRRDIRDFLNSPPRFGYRGTGTAWIDHLQHLHRKGGFRRNLAEVEDLARAETTLESKGNPWTEAIARWGLLRNIPYAASTTGDPGMLTAEETDREKRLAAHVEAFRNEFGAATGQEALERYAEAYGKNTEIIDAEAATIEMPGFVNDPPLSLDPHLKYEVGTLPGGGALVASVFDNITSGTVGMAFNLDVVPPSQLVYVPALPTLLRNVGVMHEGAAVPYDEFDEMLRREILSLSVYFSVDRLTESVELNIRGEGSEQGETLKALEWMQTVLLNPDLRPENLPRIRDAVDVGLKSARNRMRGSEESWVDEPVFGFWKQHNRLLLHADCFLTQAHALHRLRWMLKEGDASGVREMGEKMVGIAQGGDREALDNALAALVEGDGSTLAKDAAEDLRTSLSDIPDGSLVSDLRYLTEQMAMDLEVDPRTVLAEIVELLNTIRARDNVRAYVVSSSSDRKALTPKIEEIVAGLGEDPSRHQSNTSTPLVTDRARERGAPAAGPLFVALVNENTRSGVHYHTADCANYAEREADALLRFLSARLYGGGGAHSMFMKTWGAGLAYSNGLRSNESNGRLIYYAERCPDLTQTMQFVVGELESAPHDPSLADYAVAQAFGGNRSGARYEERGAAMAADLARGVTPEVVAGFRKKILELRRDPSLYEKLHGYMKETYGEILPGYGPSGAEAAGRGNAIYYVIGPEKQIQSWEAYLKTAEPGVQLTRIYPRDYWQVREETAN